jgi:hypothetical protein
MGADTAKSDSQNFVYAVCLRCRFLKSMVEDGLEWWFVHLVGVLVPVLGPHFVLRAMCQWKWTTTMRELFDVGCAIIVP